VGVLDHDHHGLVGGPGAHPLQQPVGEPRAGHRDRGAGQRDDSSEQLAETAAPRWVGRGPPGGEERRVRDVPTGVRGATADENAGAGTDKFPTARMHEAALPDPGRPGDDDRPPGAGACGGEGLAQHGQLRVPSYETGIDHGGDHGAEYRGSAAGQLRNNPQMTPADGNAILEENFAPWVQELGLVVEEVGERHAVARLPWSDRLAREGGGLSGQAMMAAADTTTVIAISAMRGGFGPMTTVQQSTMFQRPAIGVDTMVTATVSRLGRTLAFVDVVLTADKAVVATASTVYAILG